MLVYFCSISTTYQLIWDLPINRDCTQLLFRFVISQDLFDPGFSVNLIRISVPCLVTTQLKIWPIFQVFWRQRRGRKSSEDFWRCDFLAKSFHRRQKALESRKRTVFWRRRRLAQVSTHFFDAEKRRRYRRRTTSNIIMSSKFWLTCLIW